MRVDQLAKARSIVDLHLKSVYDDPDDSLVVTKIEERDWCWIFSYDSKRHVETGSRDYMIGGNGPIVIVKGSFRLVSLLSYGSITDQLDALQREVAR